MLRRSSALRSAALALTLVGSLVTSAAARGTPPKNHSPGKSHSSGNGKNHNSGKKPSNTKQRQQLQKHPKVVVPQGWPKILSIPKLGVKAAVEDISLTKASDVHAPFRWGDVAWYSRSPRPGAIGRSEIFGHLDSTCCPAVFYHLKDLRKGDIASVEYKNNKYMRFRVMWTGIYADNKLPTKFLYGPSSERGLVLMTCAGVFHRDGTGYDHRVLVYLRLLLPNGRLA